MPKHDMIETANKTCCTLWPTCLLIEIFKHCIHLVLEALEQSLEASELLTCPKLCNHGYRHVVLPGLSLVYLSCILHCSKVWDRKDNAGL